MSPTLDTVHRLARSVGYEMTMEFFPVPTREERRNLALHRAIAQRLSTDPQRTLDRARATLARVRESQPGADPLLRDLAGVGDLSEPLRDAVKARIPQRDP
jgi:hypothetical protein